MENTTQCPPTFGAAVYYQGVGEKVSRIVARGMPTADAASEAAQRFVMESVDPILRTGPFVFLIDEEQVLECMGFRD